MRDHFRLGEAAALWLNYEPENPPLASDVRDVYWRLHSDIYAGKLRPTGLDEAVALALTKHDAGIQPDADTEDPVTVETMISRKELRRYAADNNERPPFLFKDARVTRPTSSS